MTITIVSSASYAANTGAMPAHDVGYTILVWATRNNATTPTIPSGQGWQLMGSATVTGESGILVAKIATANNHTLGTWTNATGLSVVVLDGSAGIGVVASGSGTSGSPTYPAATLQNSDGTSWTMRFGAQASATNQTTNAPTTAPNTLVTGQASRNSVWSSNAGTASNPTSGTQSVNTSAAWVALTVEIIDGSSGAAFTDNCSTLDTTRWLTGGTGTISAVSNALQFASSGSQAPILKSRQAWDLTDGSFSFRAGSIAATSRRLYMGVGTLLMTPTFRSGALVDITNGIATAKTLTNGTEATVGSTRTHTANDYYRIRHDSATSTLYWETSTNGTSWSSWTSTTSFQLPLYWQVFARGIFTSSVNFTVDDITITLPAPPIPEADAGTGNYGWSSAAIGRTQRNATSSGAYTWSSAATGRTQRNATSSGNYLWTGSATGAATPKATAGTSTYNFTTLGAGDVDYTGYAAGTYTFAGSAEGLTPVTAPTGHGAYEFFGSAVGRSARVGQAAGDYTWASTSTGRRNSKALAGNTSYSFETTDRVGKRVAKASAGTRAYSFEASAPEGHRTGAGTAAGTYKWVALATGLFVPKPVAGVVGWYAE